MNEKTYRENEVIAKLENIRQKQSPSPHHLDKIIGHVNLLPREINAVRLQSITVQPPEFAAIVGRLINRNE